MMMREHCRLRDCDNAVKRKTLATGADVTMWVRLAVVTLVSLAGLTPVSAQVGSPFDDDPFWERPSSRAPQQRFEYDNRLEPRGLRAADDVRDGGPRPQIQPESPPIVAFEPDYPAGSIVIDSGQRRLYFVLPGRKAFQYPISVGREGFAWAGSEKISRKQAWPDWNPPAEMRKRDPKLPVKMTGGLRNPLGAMALYLGNSLYRIHGTNDEKTIGYASSSGCFRMMNSAVLHLAQFAQVGTTVTVVNHLPNAPALPPPVAQRRPAAEPPVARRQLPPPSPPPAVARRPLPPVEPAPPVARRPLPPQPPVARAEPDDREWDDVEQPVRRAPPADYRQRRDDRRDDVADVTVTPSDGDDYDPYYVRRRPYDRGLYDGRRFARDRFADRPYARRSFDADSYDGAGGGRIWYDDERDDY
jgi:lipoprotein-anchoring transpeptidase ErfK/SrfK